MQRGGGGIFDLQRDNLHIIDIIGNILAYLLAYLPWLRLLLTWVKY